MTAPLARAIVRSRFFIIAGWVGLAVLAVPRAARIGDVLSVEGGPGPKETESQHVYRLVRDDLPRPIVQFFVVTIHGPVRVERPRYSALLDSLTAAAAREPYVNRVVSYHDARDSSLVSRDHRTTFFIAALGARESANATPYTPVFRAAIDSAIARFAGAGDFDIHVTGAPALDYDVRAVSMEDARIGERRSVPLAAGVLILAFGALVAAMLPLIVGVVGITSSLALVYLASSFHTMSIYVLNIVSMVGLGVGID